MNNKVANFGGHTVQVK